jgi:hypothetical protein
MTKACAVRLRSDQDRESTTKIKAKREDRGTKT